MSTPQRLNHRAPICSFNKRAQLWLQFSCKLEQLLLEPDWESMNVEFLNLLHFVNSNRSFSGEQCAKLHFESWHEFAQSARAFIDQLLLFLPEIKRYMSFEIEDNAIVICWKRVRMQQVPECFQRLLYDLNCMGHAICGADFDNEEENLAETSCSESFTVSAVNSSIVADREYSSMMEMMDDETGLLDQSLECENLASSAQRSIEDGTSIAEQVQIGENNQYQQQFSNADDIGNRDTGYSLSLSTLCTQAIQWVCACVASLYRGTFGIVFAMLRKIGNLIAALRVVQWFIGSTPTTISQDTPNHHCTGSHEEQIPPACNNEPDAIHQMEEQQQEQQDEYAAAAVAEMCNANDTSYSHLENFEQHQEQIIGGQVVKLYSLMKRQSQLFSRIEELLVQLNKQQISLDYVEANITPPQHIRKLAKNALNKQQVIVNHGEDTYHACLSELTKISEYFRRLEKHSFCAK